MTSLGPAGRPAYRLVVRDASADDCDFWLALAGQTLPPFVEFVRAIDAAIPDRAGISRIEQWQPRGAALEKALNGIETAPPEQWAEMIATLNSAHQPMLTWGPRH